MDMGMGAGMDMGGEEPGSGDQKGGPGEMQRVPLAALATPDEGDQMANPEVGDMVSYQVEGKIARIDGDDAFVTAEKVNGEPLDEAPGEQKTEDQAGNEQPNEGDEYAGLEEQARNTTL